MLTSITIEEYKVSCSSKNFMEIAIYFDAFWLKWENETNLKLYIKLVKLFSSQSKWCREECLSGAKSLHVNSNPNEINIVTILQPHWETIEQTTKYENKHYGIHSGLYTLPSNRMRWFQYCFISTNRFDSNGYLNTWLSNDGVGGDQKPSKSIT